MQGHYTMLKSQQLTGPVTGSHHCLSHINLGCVYA